MNQSPCEMIEVSTSEATESSVRLTLRERSRGQIVSFQGELRGPRCRRARTLAATFAVQGETVELSDSVSSSTLITDPCYWSPALPFLYDLNLELHYKDGSKQPWRHSIGVRRFEAHGPHLFREGKRTVLRGVGAEALSSELLQEASEAEVSLLVSEPAPELLEQASELGVSLVLDLREQGSDLATSMISCGWYPAIDCVVVSEEPPFGTCSALLGQAVEPNHSDPVANWAQLHFCETDGSAELPEWLKTSTKPILISRSAGSLSDMVAARRACDRLQSDLAPEFDLAGYFV